MPRTPTQLLSLAGAIALALGLSGCGLFGGGKDEPTTRWSISDGPRGDGETPSGLPTDLRSGAANADPAADPSALAPDGVRVDVWALAVPRGTVSANEAFWKRVDESAVPPDRYELLFVNGFRVGVARREDWDYFRDLLSRNPVRHRLNALTISEEKSIEVSVRSGIESQVLSYFEEGKPAELRSYDRSENLLLLSFIPSPGRAAAARIALAPVVRTARERVEYNPDNSERPIRFITPERIYELNLAVQVPFGQFMVVSPSTDTARRTSIGRNFLLSDGDAEQSELVLLIVPSPVRVTERVPPNLQPPQPPAAPTAAPEK